MEDTLAAQCDCPVLETAEESAAGEIASRLNWLRAGVLGANDGIVSTAGLVMGVAGADAGSRAILIAGLAGLAAGAMSMAAGEYVSVSTQRDTEKAALTHEAAELAEDPDRELEQLTTLIQHQGIERKLARQVAVQLTARDALAAHAHYELGINPDELTNPWAAAGSSFVSFIAGAIIPLLAIVLAPTGAAEIVCVAAVVVALCVTGFVSARLGSAPPVPATIRNVCGGLLAMGVTYGIGTLIGG
jgi:VIT1/CCC1 family predicted Fe2+/Mn2+ transporter